MLTYEAEQINRNMEMILLGCAITLGCIAPFIM